MAKAKHDPQKDYLLQRIDPPYNPRFVALIGSAMMKEVDNVIMSKGIRKHQDAYRKIVSLGLIEFKKLPRGGVE